MLQRLPTELLLEVITSTNIPTLFSLRLVSRALHSVIQTHERSIALGIPVHAFSSTTTVDFPAHTCSRSGVPDFGWLKELERRESVLRELDVYVHRFSGADCDCGHPVEQQRHARGLRKLWALSDACRLSNPPLNAASSSSPPPPPAPPLNPRLALLASFQHAHLIELWNTTEILMIELKTAYIESFLRPPLSPSNALREPWCHIFEGGPEWVLRVLKGKDAGDWAGEQWRWSVVYDEVLRAYMVGEKRAV